MVRHLRKPGHPRRRRLVSYRPPVRSITPRQPPGRSGSPPPPSPPPPLSTFLPLSPSLPLFCSIFSLFHLPRLLLFDCSLFSSSFLSLLLPPLRTVPSHLPPTILLDTIFACSLILFHLLHRERRFSALLLLSPSPT